MTPSGQNSSAPERRSATLQSLSQGTLDLLVIGGGIVGAGVARDAAMRGLRVGLVDQYDFAFGTSSRSSRLLHGGLRYLAQGRLALVREASVEKGVLHRIAPHLAIPLPIIFPAYRDTPWPLWQMRIGVKIYDLLCNGKNFGKSGALSRTDLLAQVPHLSSDGLVGAVRYFDAMTNDARLVIDTLRSAAKNGALVLNYLQFRTATLQSSYWAAELQDLERREKHTVRARAIVNATGPWAQNVQHSRVKLRLTKGIHIVIDRSRLEVSEAVAIAQGKRLLFVIPWGERLILGTTDTDYSGSIENVRPDPSDIDYLLNTMNRFFPKAALSSADILSTWAGLRPLIAGSEGTPSDMSRSHQLRNPEPGWWDLAGGKLTTYRLMAEQTLDRIVNWLIGLKKSNGNKKFSVNGSYCRTAEEPLLTVAETEGLSGILPPKFEREIVEHYCTDEWALHLDDIMLRRTGWQHYSQNAPDKAEQAADWMAQLLHWTSDKRKEELERCRTSSLSRW